MILTTKNEKILRAVNALLKVSVQKSADRNFENIRFDAEDGSARLSALNDMMTCSIRVECDRAAGEKPMAVNAIFLSRLLSSIPKTETVTLSSKKDSDYVELIWSTGNAQMPEMGTESWPEERFEFKEEGANEITVSQEELVRMFGNVLYAVGDGDLRPMMKNIRCEFHKDGGAVSVATDTKRLAIYGWDIRRKADKDTMVLHLDGKLSAFLKSVMATDNKEVNIRFTKKRAVIRTEEMEVVSILMDDRFAPWQTVIPEESKAALRCSRQEFIRSIKRVATTTMSSTNNLIKMDMSQGRVELSSSDMNFRTSTKETVAECSYEGEPIVIGFNSTGFLEVLENMLSEFIEVRFLERNKPMLVIPTDENGEQCEPVTAIVMPLMVK